MIIDTHVHTTCSDGRKSVAEVFELASKLGISLLSITDHDTICAYPEAFKEADMKGVAITPGVELSTRDEDGHKDVHIVGLGLDVDNTSLRTELRKLADARVNARRKLLENTNRYFAERYGTWKPVTFEEVRIAAGSVIGKPHIAAAVHSHAIISGIPISEDSLYDIFNLPGVRSKKEYELTMEECIRLVKGAGGVPVLAHPCEYSDMDGVMKKFVRLGGEATEICKYRYKTKLDDVKKLEMPERLEKEREMNMKTIHMAKKYGLKLTASSDYHAKTGEPGMDTEEYGIDVDWLMNDIR